MDGSVGQSAWFLIPSTYLKKEVGLHLLKKWQRQENGWDSLASQSGLIGDVQWKTLSQKPKVDMPKESHLNLASDF